MIEVKIKYVISDIIGKGFIEPAKLYKLYSIGKGKVYHNVRQGNDILHFHMGPYLREITDSAVEDGLEDGLEGGKFRWWGNELDNEVVHYKREGIDEVRISRIFWWLG